MPNSHPLQFIFNIGNRIFLGLLENNQISPKAIFLINTSLAFMIASIITTVPKTASLKFYSDMSLFCAKVHQRGIVQYQVILFYFWLFYMVIFFGACIGLGILFDSKKVLRNGIEKRFAMEHPKCFKVITMIHVVLSVVCGCASAAVYVVVDPCVTNWSVAGVYYVKGGCAIALFVLVLSFILSLSLVTRNCFVNAAENEE